LYICFNIIPSHISSSVIILRPSAPTSSSPSSFQVLLLQRSSSLKVCKALHRRSWTSRCHLWSRPFSSILSFFTEVPLQVAPSFYVFPGGSLEESDKLTLVLNHSRWKRSHRSPFFN
jgi:hypothetical protein